MFYLIFVTIFVGPSSIKLIQSSRMHTRKVLESLTIHNSLIKEQKLVVNQ